MRIAVFIGLSFIKVLFYYRQLTSYHKQGLFQIKEYPKYEISNLGNFRHIKHQHNRKLQLDRYGYYQVLLNLGKNHKPQYKGLLISRLVAQTFIPNPDNLPEVHHINNIRTDNQATNLQWIKRLNNLFKRNNFKKIF